MQLTSPNPGRPAGALHLALAAATVSLLGTAHAEGLQVNDWQVDSAVLVYKEGEGRVQAVEPIVAIRRTDGNERSMGLRLTFDTLTGASPSGAVAQPTAQTFTNPSGRGGGYTTDAGKAPLDPRFHDQRIAVLGSYEQPLGAGQRLSLSGNVSTEHDFNSISVSSSFAQDFNQKNSTLSLGLSFETDRIRPEGGVLAELKPAFGASTRVSASDSRRVVDLLAGFTQVMSRSWLMQVSYNLGKGTGYHSDPYKVLSIIDGTTGLVTGDQYIVESRPRSRTRHSVNLQNKWHLTQDVVDVSYRYYRDDWGLRAHTLDARYRFEMGGGLYLEPHARYYRQNAADFYRTWLTEGSDYSSASSQSALPYASADTRLAAFTANTLGLKFGMPLSGGQELSLRVEAYRQKLKEPGAAPGALQGLELMPNLRATTLMLSYSRPF